LRAGTRDGTAYGCKQDLGVERLAEKAVIDHGKSTLPVSDLMSPCNQDDRQPRAPHTRKPLQFKPVDPRHANVGYYALDRSKGIIIKQRLPRAETPHPVTGRFKEVSERFDDPEVVVDNCDREQPRF